jgi:hypothetical protein
MAKQRRHDREFLMTTQDIVDNWRQEAVQEGVEQGVATSLIDIYEARFGAIPADLRAVVDGTHDETALRGWLRLAVSAGADDVAATLRALRAS